MRAVRIAIFLGVFVSGPYTASAVDVTACGQVVPAREIGTLQADLDCSASPGICFYYLAEQPEQDVACTADAECEVGLGGRCSPVAVTLERSSTLDLNGHSLTGAGVLCANRARCTVEGGGAIVEGELVGAGEIVGAQGFGIYARGPLRVHNTVVRDGGYVGIMSLRGKMRLTNVTASHNLAFGIHSVDGHIIVENVVANDNLHNNGINAFRTVRGKNLTANGNRPVGVTAKRIAVRGLTVNGNAEYGIIAGKILLRDSELLDNGAGDDDPLDIYLTPFGLKNPSVRVINTTCGFSNAGVCAGD